MHNPLLQPILDLLIAHPTGIDEYRILKTFEEHPAFANIGSEGKLPLFHKHFIVMNALYQLQQSCWKEQQQVLEITPLLNTLHQNSPSSSDTQLIQAESRGPSEYYLNWENFHGTTEDDVAQLYKSFWTFLSRDDKRAAALECLGLEAAAREQEITQRYRQLAKQHHPDTGGDAKLFIKVRAAYEVLKENNIDV